MEIFLSWSGDHSLAIANALRTWLPKIVNAFKPWLSSSDINKGTRWGVDVASRLNSAKAGIICLTPDNLHSDWILFEAGAISKTVETPRVCTLLVGLETSDLEPPLSQFQATKANEVDILELVKTLNLALGESALPNEHVVEAFRMCWPTLKAALDNLPISATAHKPVRSERQLIEEILALVRGQSAPPLSQLDEDRQYIIQGRAHKLIFRGGAAGVTTSSDGKNVRIEATGSDGIPNYVVTIPKDIPLEEIEKHVQSQIPAKEQLPPADAKTAGP